MANHKFLGAGIADDGSTCELGFRDSDGKEHVIEFDPSSALKIIECLMQAHTAAMRRQESSRSPRSVFQSQGEIVALDPDSGDVTLTFQHGDGFELSHLVARSRLDKLMASLSRAAHYQPPTKPVRH